MKRCIQASKYSKKADRALRWLSQAGQCLANVASAKDDFSAVEAFNDFYNVGYVKTKKEAVEFILNSISDIGSEFLLSYSREASLPEVESAVVDYLKSLGYDMAPMSTPPRGADKSYVIIPANECTHEDLKSVASAVSREFGLKPDTGIIGGSWTSYEFKMNGVSFRIGFEDDKDFDPSGRESSLQLYF